MYGGKPPYAVRFAVYGWPAMAAGSEVVLMVSVPPGAEMVSEKVCVFVSAGELLSET